MLAFDNVSRIPPALADAFCRIATGASYVARKLYSDDEEVLLQACRPAILNGIPELSSRPDLVDRAILLTLPVIEPHERKSERQFNADFEAAAPGIMGAICYALSSVLRNRASIHLESPPRMADFAHAIVAAEEGLGWTPGSFIGAYEANRELALVDVASQDPIIEAISNLLRQREGLVIESAAGLLVALTAVVGPEGARRRSWPKLPNMLSRSLRRLAPVMRSMGLEVELDYERQKDTNIKLIRIKSALPPM